MGARGGAIVGAEGAAAFIDLIESGRVKELKCPADKHGGYAATLIPAVDYIQAMRLRRPMRRAVAKLFEKFDVDRIARARHRGVSGRHELRATSIRA